MFTQTVGSTLKLFGQPTPFLEQDANVESINKNAQTLTVNFNLFLLIILSLYSYLNELRCKYIINNSY